MKVSLSVLERLKAMELLPAEESIVTLRTVRKAKEILGFTDEEQKVYEFVNTDIGGGRLTTRWNFVDKEGKAVPQDKEFELGEKACDLIGNSLKKLEEQKKLTDNHISLYEKFIENKPKE